MSKKGAGVQSGLSAKESFQSKNALPKRDEKRERPQKYSAPAGKGQTFKI